MISEVTGPSSVSSTDGYRLADDVLLIRLDDGTARLMDLGGDIYAMTDAAALVITDALSSEAAGRAELGADEEDLLAGLSRAGLVLSPRMPAPKKRWTPLAVLFRPGLRLALRSGSAGALVTLAHASAHALGWAATVRLWLQAAEERAGSRPCDVVIIEARVSRAIAHHPLDVGCKERALCCYLLARMAGLPVRLVLGVYPFPFSSHVWCESGDRILGDRYEDGCDLYTPVLVYGHGR